MGPKPFARNRPKDLADRKSRGEEIPRLTKLDPAKNGE
jgi:hypothetical protein